MEILKGINLMKITPHNAGTYQVSTQNTGKNPKKELTTEKKSFQDSLVLSAEKDAANIKEANQAIGALQVMNRALKDLDGQLQNMINAHANPQDTQEQIQKTLNTTFNGKRIFDQDFSKLSSNIKLDSTGIKKYAQNISSTQDLYKLSSEIKKERNQASDAITILQNQLSSKLKTDASYDKLDPTKLGNLANAHNANSLSLSRVSELLA